MSHFLLCSPLPTADICTTTADDALGAPVPVSAAASPPCSSLSTVLTHSSGSNGGGGAGVHSQTWKERKRTRPPNSSTTTADDALGAPVPVSAAASPPCLSLPTPLTHSSSGGGQARGVACRR
mmetsp:Transcript_39332/g.66942  ORF Transcript_39332/g.66942 Transcript_39332/m.66942 type:complete len:123 (-) Transcript_39332:282-650(-)